MKRISSPIESRMVGKGVGDTLMEADFLIIGSGYGGAVAAMRLANGKVAGACEGADPIPSVVVLERGREYNLGDFPYDMEDLPSHVRMQRSGQDPGGYPDALFHVHVGAENTYPNDTTTNQHKDSEKAAVDVLVGSGLGGTSLINANVAEKPEPHVFRKSAWPREFRDSPGLLDAAYAQVAEYIGVTTHTAATGREFPKYSALQRLGRALGHPARPAMLAVTTVAVATEAVTAVAATSEAPSSTAQDAHTRTNKVGVQQSPCTNCGNCVTGCNVGAKNTLDRNLLRLAKSRGAEFYTGVTVDSIEPLPPQDSDTDRSYRWKVMVRTTVKPTERPRANPDDPVVHDTYCILARKVILAAGALGSTGILLRSQQSGQLQLSATLGEKFSTNGDGIIMSYGQQQRVGAIAQAEQKAPVAAVGPTITGIIRTGKLTIEEASIPAALGRLFSELVTTSAMLQRIAKRKLPPLLKDSGRDPLAASREVADHCQALLIMGDDGANGQLSLADTHNTLNIAFPQRNISDNSALKEANRLLRAQDRKAGLDGGQYAPNPLWQLLPPEATGVLSGSMPVRRVLTVHPLGGCAMADDVNGGVVNHCGQVFRRDGQMYDGLYVMDGSIIPTALEVNPFLTIAALAWRNVGLIPDSAKDAGCDQVDPEYADLGEVPCRQRSVPQPTQFVIQEQLTGQLDRLTPAFTRLLQGRDPQCLLQKNGLVVQISAQHDNAETWLDNPGAVPLKASLKLYANPLPLEQRELYGAVGVHPARLRGEEPLLTLDGSFRVFAEDAYDCSADVLGFFSALKAYRTRRAHIRWLPPGTGEDLLRNPVKTLRKLWTAARTFINIAVLQSRFRRLSYTFGDATSLVTIRGEKVIGYSLDIQRMWDGLLNLDVSITGQDGAGCVANLHVNVEHLLEPGLLEVTKSAHLPQSLLFASGLAAFAARALFATNLWEFGGLVYRDTPRAQPEPTVLKTRWSGAVTPQPPVFFPVPLRADSDATIQLRLTRYHREGGKPLLLLHGLAQGSQIFWLEGIYNLAAYFHDAGFDVWLLDYRLSNLVLPNLPVEQRNWSMDEIAQFDIPLAIARVCALTKHEKISVFGHCVGACTLAMAALRDADVGARIEAAVTNAIHPWVIASPANQFRAKLGNFYREWVPGDILDPNPAQGAGGLQNIVDRLAFSLARMNEGNADDHLEYGGSELEQSVCDRMSFLYGRMWSHKNLDPTTHAAFPGMLGPAPASVYQHLYYHSSLRRITDANGENTYLTEDNIRNHWQFPIMFVHGNDSCVFNPHSARRSAYRLHGILNTPPATARLDTEAVERIPVRFRIYPDYGHMDVIFGRDAHKTCFRDYVDFLRAPDTVGNSDTEPDWDETLAALPVTGPILRAVWKEGDNLYIRLWAELRTNVTYRPDNLVVAGGQEIAEFELETPKPDPAGVPRFRMIDVELTHTDAPLHLTLRGGIEDHDGYRGAELMYSEQAWWQRLRAGSGDRHQARMCFVIGSCRYPGSIVDNALSDKVYAAIQEHTTAAEGAQLLFLIGDQIYADATDQLVATQSPKAKYTDRYRRAFAAESSPHFAHLVAQVPTHFALDDHEKGDNWEGAASVVPPDLPSIVLSAASRTESDHHAYAVNMAARFMGSGRNHVPLPGPTRSSRHYYALSYPAECDFPTFVTDTRSERKYRRSNDPSLYCLMEPSQYRALVSWLLRAHRQHPQAPKFIFSGSIIAPLATQYCREPSTWRQQDGWAGYPATMEALLKLIAEKRIQKVVFVGGDAHLSAVSRLTLKQLGEASGTEVWQIVSSGLYAPLPFANAHVEDYLWSQSHALPVHVQRTLSIECMNSLLSDHYSQFVRVDATVDEVTVTCFDETNTVLARHELFR